jgi:hypothetical protein
MVMHACSLSTWEPEAEELQIPDHLGYSSVADMRGLSSYERPK